METLFENLKNIHKNICDNVWPEGWHGKCHTCGKLFYYTKEECTYYLKHGWPECDHKKKK